MRKSKGTILFVHGLCHGSWCWEEAFIPFFEDQGYRCLAIDLEGHQAGNYKTINHIRLADFVRNVEEAIAGLPEPPIIIGHSMGGMVVQHYLKKGSCKKVVLMASVPPAGALAASLRVITKYPGAIKYLVKGDLLGFAHAYQPIFFGEDHSESQLEVYKKQLCSESFIAYLQLLFPVGKLDFSGEMLVIGGDHDGIFTTREMKQTAAKHQADLKIIQGGTHDLMLDPQKLEVAHIIHQWLED